MTIVVDAVPISQADIDHEARYHRRGASAAQAEAEATRALVVRQLLLQEAARRNLLAHANGSQEQAIRMLIDQAVAVPEVPESECVAFFEAHRERFLGPDLFEPSHILFAAPPDSAEGRVAALTAAREALCELRRDPERFERIARERSGCPSGRDGGSLGQITAGETEPAFEQHMRALAVGAISEEPLETDHGFHILRLDQHAKGAPLPYESVADRIRLYLRDGAWRRSLHAFIAGLAAQAKIEGYRLAAG